MKQATTTPAIASVVQGEETTVRRDINCCGTLATLLLPQQPLSAAWRCRSPSSNLRPAAHLTWPLSCRSPSFSRWNDLSLHALHLISEQDVRRLRHDDLVRTTEDGQCRRRHCHQHERLIEIACCQSCMATLRQQQQQQRKKCEIKEVSFVASNNNRSQCQPFRRQWQRPSWAENKGRANNNSLASCRASSSSIQVKEGLKVFETSVCMGGGDAMRGERVKNACDGKREVDEEPEVSSSLSSSHPLSLSGGDGGRERSSKRKRKGPLSRQCAAVAGQSDTRQFGGDEENLAPDDNEHIKTGTIPSAVATATSSSASSTPGEKQQRKDERSSLPPLLRVTDFAPGEMEREELRQRLEQSLGGGASSGRPRLPRMLTMAQRRRRAAGMVKQWSMDETKSWFYARSASQDRGGVSTPPPVVTERNEPCVAPVASAADRKRKFFQRKSTLSAPASSTESVDSTGKYTADVGTPGAGGGAVTRVLEEVLKASSALFTWESCDLDQPLVGHHQFIGSVAGRTHSPIQHSNKQSFDWQFTTSLECH